MAIALQYLPRLCIGYVTDWVENVILSLYAVFVVIPHLRSSGVYCFLSTYSM